MRTDIKADFPQNAGEKKIPPHLKQQQLLTEGPPRSNLSVPVENYQLQLCTVVTRMSLMGVLLALTH